MIQDYINAGWKIIPIPRGGKGPRIINWNTIENALVAAWMIPTDHGVGLMHAYSGTMALDIDDTDLAVDLLGEKGISLPDLYNDPKTVRIESGRTGRAKFLYKMPGGLTLPSKRVNGPTGTILEFRCATSNGLTCQDVLPPSIHPDTSQPYRWEGAADYTNPPVIPDSLLDYWKSLIEVKVTESVSDPLTLTSLQTIREALLLTPPDLCREEWINIGMALHHWGNQNKCDTVAFSEWDAWSSKSSIKYPGRPAMVGQWKSFKTDRGAPITLGTLFRIASEHGWVRKPDDTSTLFKNVGSLTPPLEIHEGIRPLPPEMDLSLWPTILQKRAKEISEAVGCDPLVPLWAGLGSVCGVIDSRIRLELMPGFKVPPILWLMTIGDPADKKTPGAAPMLDPLVQLELEDRPRFKKELLVWEGHEAAYAAAKKSFLEFSASPEAMMGSNAIPTVPDLPSQPVPLKITVTDITSQKLVRHCAERPRGLLCTLDEMSSWVRKLCERSSGEDRSTWVVSYEGKAYDMDRVGAGSIHCENLAVSIYGNIQPKVFQEVLNSLSSDGLLQRFIPAVLREGYTKRGEPLSEFMTSAKQWESLLRTTQSLPPIVYKLSSDAYTLFRNFQTWYEEAKRDERLLSASDVFMTAFGKIEGTCGRLILLFHAIESPFCTEVSESVVFRVIRLIKTYIIPSLRYALSELSNISSFDSWLIDYIVQNSNLEKITLHEIKASARRRLEDLNVWKADQVVYGGMAILEKAEWVSRIDDGARENQHIAVWAINPSILTQFKDNRRAIIEAKQRRVDQIRESRGWKRLLVNGNNE